MSLYKAKSLTWKIVKRAVEKQLKKHGLSDDVRISYCDFGGNGKFGVHVWVNKEGESSIAIDETTIVYKRDQEALKKNGK